MNIAIKVIGVLIILMGVLYMIKPNVMKSLMQFFKKGSRIYAAGIARLALAVVFLLAAGECRLKWVIAGFGIIFLLSGLLVFMLGAKRLGPMMEWFGKQPGLILRILAGIVLAIGAIITYSA